MDYGAYEAISGGLRNLRLTANMWSAMATPWLKLASHSPFWHGDLAQASLEMFDRIRIRHSRPDYGIDDVMVGNRLVPVIEEEVVPGDTPDKFGRLLHFRKDVTDRGPVALIIPPLSGHFSTLTRNTIRSMLKEHDVYVIDWQNARDIRTEHGTFDLNAYIRLLIAYLTYLGPETHVLAICQAGVPALAAVSVMSMDNAKSAPKTLTLFAAPIDPRQNPTAPCRFAASRPLSWFENHMIKTVAMNREGYGRRVYPGFLQLSGFMSMNPDRHFGKLLEKLTKLAEGDEVGAEEIGVFYDEYLSVMDLTAEFYLSTIDLVFQRFALPQGCFPYGDIIVDPAAVTRTSVFTLEGDSDDITGLGQTKAALDLLTGLPRSMKNHLTVRECGHYGVFNGKRFEGIIMPWMEGNIRAHA